MSLLIAGRPGRRSREHPREISSRDSRSRGSGSTRRSFEGIASRTLARGPGHVPGTALPGSETGKDNAVIAVARDVGGTELAELRLGDRVEMRTPFGVRRYRVVEWRVYDPQEVGRRSPRARVRLLTAYPAESIGPAPMRLEVALEHARDPSAAKRRAAS